MIEAIAEAAHLAIQFVFTGVSKGRMTDIVTESESFGELFIEIQRGSHGAGNLRDFDGVSEAVMKMVGDAGREDLGFILQPPKSPRMDEAVAITLVFAAVRMRQFGISPAPALFDRKTQAA
jgi:hypothetical protein